MEFEKKIIDFVKKNYIIIGFIFITIVALLIRYFELGFKSNDYKIFLSKWFDQLKNNGGIKGIPKYSGDYNAPYITLMALLTYIPINKLYLIKFLSIIFDFSLAISSSCLVRYLAPKNKKIFGLLTYMVILFLPEVLFNGALWGQCDSCYATFVILALLFLLKEKHIHSFIFLGIAFAFKLQFIFVLPIFIVLYLTQESEKRISILHFFIIPLVNFILCLPAIIFGKSIKEVLLIYFNQSTSYKNSLVLNFPNIYNLIPGDPKIFNKVGILFTLVICASMLAYIIYKNVKWNNEKILTLTLWFMIIITYLLPGMHERYLFVGEILAVICYIVYRKNLNITLCVIINAIITYSTYLFKVKIIDYSYLSIIYLLIIIYFTKDTLNLISKKR